ncbi:MAG: AraC family transcriptional regulator [Phormidesmis sp.]
MTITLSQADYWELIEAADAETVIVPDGDSVCPFPARLGEGHCRLIPLRAGIELSIEDYYLNEDVVVTNPDRLHPLEYTFEQISTAEKSHQSYSLCGSGLAPEERWHMSGGERIIRANVHIDPALFQQWIGDVEALPVALKPLLRSPDQTYLTRSGKPLTTMRSGFQQILHCPYQGLTRRLYLESKIWEMMALLLDDLGSDEAAPLIPPLKPDDVERIHYAGEILRSHLTNPPSLMGLARQVQVNDHKLKVGFRQVFGTTVFGYLHDCRMEQSRQLLESGSISVCKAAQAVGFANRSHFAVAFRKKFGMNPSLYRQRKHTAFRAS